MSQTLLKRSRPDGWSVLEPSFFHRSARRQNGARRPAGPRCYRGVIRSCNKYVSAIRKRSRPIPYRPLGLGAAGGKTRPALPISTSPSPRRVRQVLRLLCRFPLRPATRQNIQDIPNRLFTIGKLRQGQMALNLIPVATAFS